MAAKHAVVVGGSLAGLLTALVAADVGVTQFREVQTDLEEAFMTVARADEERMKDQGKNGSA